MLVVSVMTLGIHCQPPLANSLLWKVTDSAGRISHVFGTIHLQDSVVFRQRDTILTLVRSATSYASEMHLDSALAMMQPSILFLKKQSLYDLLDSSDVLKVCSVLNDRLPGMGAMCTRLKPGAIGILIALGSMENTAPVAIDQFLWNLAKEHNPLLVGLETLAEQVAILDDMTAPMLVEHLNDLPYEDSLAKIMPKLYAHEDLSALSSLSYDTTSAYSGMLEKLNDQRNVRMVDRMQAMLRSGNAFIAVGALHLTGPMSILRLLKDRGYLVEPVLGGRRSQWLGL